MRLDLLAPLGPVAIVILKTTLLLALGATGDRVLHRAPAVARHLVWLTAIDGALLVPVFDRYMPMRVAVLPAPMSTLVSATANGVGVSSLPNADGAPPASDASRSVSARLTSSTHNHLSITRVLFFAWLIGALLLLVRLLAGLATVRRLIHRAQPLESTEWLHALHDAARRLGVDELPRLVMSPDVEMAFTFDTLSPAIVLPVSAKEWTGERRRAVLLHELAHIRRRDLLGHGIAALGCVAYWFNPFIWTAARKLRIESELASDEMVLRAGVRPSEYAQHLLDMVTSFGRRTPSVALAMARPKEFEGRLVAILDPLHRRSTVAWPQRGAVVALFSIMAVSIGAAAPVRRVAKTLVVEAPPATALRDTPGDAKAASPGQDAAVTPRDVRSPRARSAGHTSQLSHYAIASLLRFGPGGIINPMLMLLRDADSLQLSGPQADSIATLNRKYMIRLNEIWSPVSAYYSVHSGDGDSSLNNPVPDAPARTVRALDELVPALAGLLSSRQRSLLPPAIRSYLDPASISSATAGPDGVFVPADQLIGLRGRARGGG